MKTRLVFAVFIFLIIGGAYSVFATPVLTLTSGTSSEVNITDQDAGDTCPTVGCITFSGDIGQVWNIEVTTVSDQRGAPLIKLGSVDHSTRAGDLTITLLDTGFSIFAPTLQFDIGGTITGAHILTAEALVNGASIGVLGPFGPSGAKTPFMGSVSGPGIVSPTPYSLKGQVVITSSGLGDTTFDAAITAVPEPGSLLLIGTGLVALGLLRLRKK